MVVIEKLKPDLAILTGDRIETLAFCLTCSYMNIHSSYSSVINHHIDDLSRAAISKLNLHFAPSKQATKRLLKWGEEKIEYFLLEHPN